MTALIGTGKMRAHLVNVTACAVFHLTMPDLNRTPRAGYLVDRRREKLGDNSRGGDDLNVGNNRGGICHNVNYFFAERLKVLAIRIFSYRLHATESRKKTSNGLARRDIQCGCNSTSTSTSTQETSPIIICMPRCFSSQALLRGLARR